MNNLSDTITKSASPFKIRRNARILAVQCLYNIAITTADYKPVSEIINDLMSYAKSEQQAFDAVLFLNIINGTYQNIPILHTNIQKHLLNNWKISRLAEIMQAILCLGAYELIYNLEIETSMIINEYVEIAKIFNHQGEAGFVNKVLDNIAKEKR